MFRKFSVLATATLVLLACTCRADDSLRTAPPGNWNKVGALTKGARITVTSAFEVIEGEFLTLKEDALALLVDSGKRVYPKSSIQKIELLKKGSRAKNAAIAGGIAFAVGFALGYAIAPSAADQNSLPGGERAGAGAGVGAILGGVAAGIAATAKPGPHAEEVYRAR